MSSDPRSILDPEGAARLVQHGFDPSDIPVRGPMQPHLAGPQGPSAAPPALRMLIQTWQIEQTKIISILIMTADALIVIDQVPTAVQDQLCDRPRWPRMVRGMPMHHVDASVEQAMREVDLIGRDAVAPALPSVRRRLSGHPVAASGVSGDKAHQQLHR